MTRLCDELPVGFGVNIGVGVKLHTTLTPSSKVHEPWSLFASSIPALATIYVNLAASAIHALSSVPHSFLIRGPLIMSALLLFKWELIKVSNLYWSFFTIVPHNRTLMLHISYVPYRRIFHITRIAKSSISYSRKKIA